MPLCHPRAALQVGAARGPGLEPADWGAAASGPASSWAPLLALACLASRPPLEEQLLLQQLLALANTSPPPSLHRPRLRSLAAYPSAPNPADASHTLAVASKNLFGSLTRSAQPVRGRAGGQAGSGVERAAWEAARGGPAALWQLQGSRRA